MSVTLPGPCDSGLASSAGCGKGQPEHGTLILTACILASSLAFIDGSVLNVALPSIGRGFGASTSEMQWVINAFLLPLSALLLMGGAAGDLYGRRRLLIGGIIMFTLASLLCALAPSLPLFLAGRALQGIGAAMLMPSSLAILGTAFSGEERGRAIGTWAAAGAIAGALGPMVGGWLVDAVGWRSIFFVNLPIAAGATWLGYRYVPESRDERRPSPDWLGALLATAGLAGLTWGLTVRSAGEGEGAAAIGAGVLLLFLFLLVERRRGDEAMVPLSLFGSRSFVGLTLLTFLLYGALGGLLVLVPYVLIEAAGYSALAAGSALLPFPIVIGLGSRLMGRIAARYGSRLPLTIGPLLVAGGFLLATRIGAEIDYWSAVLPAILLLSVGMAIAVAPLTTAVLTSVDARHTGTASGLNSAVARTGGLIATALLGGVLARNGTALVESFTAAALVGATLAATAGAAAFLLLEREPA